MESGLYVFPDDPEQNMRDAQCEQALWFFSRPDIERENFEDALHPMTKRKLKKYKNPDLVKKKIKTTNWEDDKDRNQLLEGKYNFGKYELSLSLVYIDGIRHIQNHFHENEKIKKIRSELERIKKSWKKEKEKYPSMKVLDKFWPTKIEIVESDLDTLIYTNIDNILKELKSSKYSLPKSFLFENVLKIDTEGFYIKPQNLIILVWSKAMKTDDRINWKIMMNTINSIYKKIRRTNLGDIFDTIEKDILFNNQETLRQINIKYTHPEYNKAKYKARMTLIDSIYKKSFIEKISPFYKFL